MTSPIKISDTFVALTGSRAVDVASKIAIRAGRFDMDSSRRMFTVQYDPDLRIDRMWQARTEEDQERLISLGYHNAAKEKIPFVSRNVLDIVSFLIEEQKTADAILLRLDVGVSKFVFMKDMINAKIGSHFEGNEIKLIADVICAMPQWYASRAVSPLDWAEAKRLVFLIDRQLSRTLNTYNYADHLDQDDMREVVLDQREIA